MLARRFNQNAQTLTNVDQDDIVASLVSYATSGAGTTGGFSFSPGSYLPLAAQNVNPDGTSRAAKSGTLRVRAYTAQTDLGQAVDDLAKVIGGYDYDALPFGVGDNATDALRVFFPQQGLIRTSPVLLYGGAVATVTRAVNSADYGNYVRVIGNAAIGEAYNADASGVVVGLWSYPNTAADVSQTATLVQQAQGDLAIYGVLVPSYTIGLTPGVFYAGMFNMGDTLPLVIMSGRLQVNTPVRVVGITYDVNDDGNENVSVALGRPTTKLTDLFGRTASDVAALARR
jgi:hypothetical protein